ncbi:hypothetical protein JAAARDRAFT_62273 [Jaapia argillacea MUCL 33604]|uniref:Uncharacterized protein n=1 Tax=Jaapia argillacea MUCL 33604 TaxID=933084 RepID=A0A067PN30_9AGAM|nr:hypothetical protein JAAARDRAFT_62273 [Jaapia argillacea MUCL 33604]
METSRHFYMRGLLLGTPHFFTPSLIIQHSLQVSDHHYPLFSNLLSQSGPQILT